MLVTAVGVNSQTGIIMQLLGAAKSAVEEDRKAAKREGELGETATTTTKENGVSRIEIEEHRQKCADLIRILQFEFHY